MKMRTEQEMLDLILGVAKTNELIRAVSMEGSRANPAAPKDCHQDYDITYYVTDMTPFYNNPEWASANFGKPLIMQMPEAMRGADNDGGFVYLMLFPDSNRVDLNITTGMYEDDGEPSITLLDKDDGKGLRPHVPHHDDAIWHIKPTTELCYYSCCNNFWWCMNNVAKGIARDELPYAMAAMQWVRSDLSEMLTWYIGIQHGYNISVGKEGKYFKKYLPQDLYVQFAASYSGSDYDDMWRAVFAMSDLFHAVAVPVAEFFSFEYPQNDEDGMREYLQKIGENKQ